HDGLYSIQLTSPTDSTAPAQDSFKLSLLIDSSNVQGQSHPVGQAVGSDPATGTADIVYHADSTGSALTADTLLAVEDGKGEAVLVSNPGNDLLEGGHGMDTVSYATAKAGVVVDLNLVGQQDTGGGGLDTLVRIDNLIGSDYHDTLIGNANDNVLIGGRGDDLLTGGGGNDTFVWQKGDTGHDTVTDFTPGADHLDLSQLLQGDGGAAASLDDFLHFKVSAAGGTVVSTIEVSSVAGAAPSQTIDLAGVDLAQHYGVTAGAGGLIASGHDTATIINGMLNDHSLKVDTV
ncbi:MAG: type I secretion C-terminal target domain-containing protein, partial [Pseudomonas sp.]